jgi:hypothetical protein
LRPCSAGSCWNIWILSFSQATAYSRWAPICERINIISFT